jgi:tetratricopeptide (TPR) repeat protein
MSHASDSRRFPALILAVLTLLAAPMVSPASSAWAQGASHEGHVAHRATTDDLGNVDFRASCAPAVREDVDRAVALLHHMMYQQSRAAFEAILEEDPQCAAAHWGVATTLFQPLWPSRPDAETRQRGWNAVETARELGVETDRERALLDATSAFFENPEEDTWWPRIERWAESMEAAHRAQPDDIEIAAFHGLAVLAAGQVADDQLAENARAAEVLRSVHEQEPLHPGAIHYTIHADDVTGRADSHLHMVEQYSEIAPMVPHALHMPSHIYVRLGEWPEVIEWNRKSADAALEHPVGDRTSFHHVHALDYLLYAHLQRGDDEQAAAVLDEAWAVGSYQDDFVTAYHLAVMPARAAVERRDWQKAARIEPGVPDYLSWDGYLWPRAISSFARGLGGAHTGDLEKAREAESTMAELQRQAEDAGEQAFATYIEIDRLILAGWIAHLEGNAEAAVRHMNESARLEDGIQKHPVSPGSLLPPREALGDLLMAQDRHAEARQAYEASLDVWPERYNSLLGAARAARASGDDEGARAHYQALLDVVENAQRDRPGIREAASMLGVSGG